MVDRVMNTPLKNSVEKFMSESFLDNLDAFRFGCYFLLAWSYNSMLLVLSQLN